MMERPLKKPKIGKSCLTCRAKKIKCCKTKPACSYCQKHNQAHLCQYDVAAAAGGGKEQEQQQQDYQIPLLSDTSSVRSDFELHPPIIFDDNLKISFETASSSIISEKKSVSPLSWNSLIKADPFLSRLYEQVDVKKLLDLSTTLKVDKTSEEAVKFDGLATNECLEYEKTIDFTDHCFRAEDRRLVTNLFEASQVQNVQTQLKSMLIKFLPTESVVWNYIDYFFKESYLYGLLPFVDENSFRKKISLILGKRSGSNSKIERININKKYDFATVGTLLIILRLSYLYTKGSQTTPTSLERIILNNPVSIEVVKIAHICSNQFCLFRRVSIEVLPFIIAVRFYHYYAPEDGDGVDGGESQTFIGLFLQSAMSIGLNKSPTKSDFEKHPKLSRIWQKIWFQIKSLDQYQVVYMGNPSIINEYFHDNKISEKVTSLNSNNNDTIYEQDVAKFQIQQQSIMSDVIQPLSKLLLRLSTEELSVNQVYAFVTQQLEKAIHEKNDLIQQATSPSYFKFYTLISFLELKNLQFSIYYRLHIGLGDNIEASVHFLRKLLSIDIGMNQYIGFLVPDNKDFKDLYGPKASITPLMPILQNTLHKIMLFEIGLIFNFLYYKVELEKQTSHDNNSSIIDGILDLLISGYKKKVEIFKNLAHSYYYSWYIAKTGTFIFNKFLNSGNLSLFREKSNYFKNLSTLFKGTPCHLINYSKDDFMDILSILKSDSPQFNRQMIKEGDVLGSKLQPDLLWQPEIDLQWIEQVFTFSPYNMSNDEYTDFSEILESFNR